RQDPWHRSLGRRELCAESAATGTRGRGRRQSVSVAISRSTLVEKARAAPIARVTLLGAIAAIVGGIILVSGLMSRSPERTWWAYHANFMFWSGLAQGMVVFAAILKLAKGHWGGVLVRFAEAAVAFTPVPVVLFIGLIIGRMYIFTWIHEPRPDDGGSLVTNVF